MGELVWDCFVNVGYLKKNKFKKIFVESEQANFSWVEPTISHKNSDTCTYCPLIQCWLQVCLLIPGHRCLT